MITKGFFLRCIRLFVHLYEEICFTFQQALVVPEKFQHILRVLNTNIDGKQKIMFALTSIKVSSATKQQLK